MTSPYPHKTLENEISTVKKYLDLLLIFRPYSWQEIQEDPFRRGSCERYLHLLLQATLDLAEAIISFKKYRKPSSYAEMFEILAEQKVIDNEMQEELRAFAKLRNSMTHDYEYLKPEHLQYFLADGRKTIEAFLQIAQDL